MVIFGVIVPRGFVEGSRLFGYFCVIRPLGFVEDSRLFEFGAGNLCVIGPRGLDFLLDYFFGFFWILGRLFPVPKNVEKTSLPRTLPNLKNPASR